MIKLNSRATCVIAFLLMSIVTMAQPERIKPPTKPAKPTTGTLSITSTPSGAVVKIGGKHMGETPLILERQKSGRYSVTFSVEGHESKTQSVTVIAGKTVTCSATLKKKQVQHSGQQQATNNTQATKSTVQSKMKLDLGYAIWTGGVKNGKPDGVGKMKFKRSHRLDSNTIAEKDDEFDGSYTNGQIDAGKLRRTNGEIITIIGEN